MSDSETKDAKLKGTLNGSTSDTRKSTSYLLFLRETVPIPLETFTDASLLPFLLLLNVLSRTIQSIWVKEESY